MKTTTKEFKTKVQNHIIARLGNPYDNEANIEIENATTAEKLENVVQEFKSWYCPYERRRNPNKAKAFRDFLQGLPSCLNVEYAYYCIRETVRRWHGQTLEESEKYSDEQIADSYYWLIYREFCVLCKQNKVEF